MKKIFIISALMYTGLAFSQVGINTPDPKVTFDITAKTSKGTSTTSEGLLLPRVDRQRAQLMSGIKTSTLIYVNSITTGSQTGIAANINATGYYYFDGNVWVKLNRSAGAAKNIYNTNDALTGNRTVSQGSSSLSFTGNNTNSFSVNNTFSVDAQNNRIGIGTNTPQNKLHLGDDAPTSITDPAGKKLAIYNNAESTSFYGLGVSHNRLQMHASSEKDTAPAMVITNEKNVGIGDLDPNSSAVLALSSFSKGFLMPRLSTAQRDAIATRPAGLAIYNSTLNCMQYWNGSSWKGRCGETAPPPAVYGCNGFSLINVNGSSSGNVNGKNVTATFSNLANVRSYPNLSGRSVQCQSVLSGLSFGFNPHITTGNYPGSSMTIKFNRNVSNLFINWSQLGKLRISFRLKKNGATVSGGVITQGGPVACQNDFFINGMTVENKGTYDPRWGPTGTRFNIGGVWFDEIEITTPTITYPPADSAGYAELGICVNSVQ